MPSSAPRDWQMRTGWGQNIKIKERIFIFPLRTIHLYVSINIPATHAWGVYNSQFIRYSRACCSYKVLVDRELMLTRNLVNQGFLVVKLMSSLCKYNHCHHNLVMEYMCHKWILICSVCGNHNPILSSFMIYHCICNKINTMDASSGIGTV